MRAAYAAIAQAAAAGITADADPTDCPTCRGLGADPVTGADCAPCHGGGTVEG